MADGGYRVREEQGPGDTPPLVPSPQQQPVSPRGGGRATRWGSFEHRDKEEVCERRRSYSAVLPPLDGSDRVRKWSGSRRQLTREVVVTRGSASVALLDLAAVADGLRLPVESLARRLARPQGPADAECAYGSPASATSSAASGLLRSVGPGVVRISRDGSHTDSKPKTSGEKSWKDWLSLQLPPSPAAAPQDTEVHLDEGDMKKLSQGELGLLVCDNQTSRGTSVEVHLASDGFRSLLRRSGSGAVDDLLPTSEDGELLPPPPSPPRRRVVFAADPVESVVVYDCVDDGVILRVVTQFPPLCFAALVVCIAAWSVAVPATLHATDHGLPVEVAATRTALVEVTVASGVCGLWLWGLLVSRRRPGVTALADPKVIMGLVAAGVFHALAHASRVAAANQTRTTCGGYTCPPAVLESLAGVVIAGSYACLKEPMHLTEYAGTFLGAAGPCVLLATQMGGMEGRATLWAGSSSLATALEVLLYRAVSHRVPLPVIVLFCTTAGLLTLFTVASVTQPPRTLLRLHPESELLAGSLAATTVAAAALAVRYLDALTIAAAAALSVSLTAVVAGSATVGLGNWKEPGAVQLVATALGIGGVGLCVHGSVGYRQTREIQLTEPASKKLTTPRPRRDSASRRIRPKAHQRSTVAAALNGRSLSV